MRKLYSVLISSLLFSSAFAQTPSNGTQTIDSGGITGIQGHVDNANDDPVFNATGGCPPAVITSQPPSAVGICQGSTTTTISVAVAEQTTTVQWQNFVSDWEDMTGEVGSDLVISLAGYYRAKLTTDCGTISYSVECSVAGSGPVILAPLPSSLYICPTEGFRAITVDAIGSGITYQWQSSPNNNANMSDIVGANDATYNATEGSTYYQVIVSACGVSITSDYVLVNTGVDNSATIFGGNTSICLGASRMLSSQVAHNSVLDWQPGGMTSANVTVSPTETTTYTFTATSTTFGCTASATTTITVIDPQPEIVDNMGTLEVTGGTFFNLQWYLDGNPISGANNYSYTPTADGDYTVSVTESGCSGTSDPFAYTGVATGIADATTNGLNIYPNPFNSEFVIETIQPTQIRVMNALGEVVLSRTINGRTSIDASNLTSGIYFVQEETSGAVMKLVKN
ncbi:MAG: T9SS type A sorting domain-containing protein [Flavobacteriales bacterium]|nr:T9SS type A sorting domain-containing protein [Flavobacteriales bacterium]